MRRRRAYTLLQLLLAVLLLGIISTVAIVRLAPKSLDSKRNACYVHKRNIEIQAGLWYRNKGSWPAADLSDIGTDGAYFPDGLPRCSVNGSAYTLNGTTHRVTGHDHP